LLDVGTPAEVIARRALHVVELEVDDPLAAAAALRGHAEVDEVEHFGHDMRVALRGVPHAALFVRSVLADRGIAIHTLRDASPNVEDAFVAMVHEDRRLTQEVAT
jgi:hypothetical protein